LLALLDAPLLQQSGDLLRKLGRLATAEDPLNASIKLLGWGLTHDRHMPDLAELQAVGREIAGLPKEQLLGLEVGMASCSFRAKADGP
jgi:hypothetical protein